MSKIRLLQSGLVVFAAIMLSGCVSMPGGIAPSTTPIEGRKYQILGPVTDTDSCSRLFGFIPISGVNTIHDAVEGAKQKRGADALIEVSVEYYTQYWFPIFIRHVTKVEGVAIRFDRQ